MVLDAIGDKKPIDISAANVRSKIGYGTIAAVQKYLDQIRFEFLEKKDVSELIEKLIRLYSDRDAFDEAEKAWNKELLESEKKINVLQRNLTTLKNHLKCKTY